jgi:hypothetical protein
MLHVTASAATVTGTIIPTESTAQFLYCTSNQQPARLSFHNLALHFCCKESSKIGGPFASHTQVSVFVAAGEGSSSIQEQPQMKHQSPQATLPVKTAKSSKGHFHTITKQAAAR